nr:MAG TPA: hypothetical protein [Caudoviricetes sp.]
MRYPTYGAEFRRGGRFRFDTYSPDHTGIYYPVPRYPPVPPVPLKKISSGYMYV